jgi:hypothetical protein
MQMKSLHWFAIVLAFLPVPLAAQNEQAALSSGTRINAALESAIDARTAKPGDRVTAKVTKDVKQNHQTVLHKGDRLVGRVTKAESESKAKSGSELGVVFDQVARGESTTQLNAVLTSVVSARGSEQSQPDAVPVELPGPAASGRSRSGSPASGGGLVGGVTGAVGSTVGVAGSASGNVGAGLGATGNSAGSVMSTPLNSIHVDTILAAEQQTAGSSVLSTKKGNLALDSGTVLQFKVAGQADARDQTQKK